MPLIEKGADNNIKLFINTRRYLLLSIILVWGTVALGAFAIKPQIDLVFNFRSDLAQEKDQYQNLVRKINELKQIEISQQFQQKETVDEVLPSHKPVLELLSNLYQAMQRAEVEVSALKINPGEIATEAAEAVITTPAQKTKKTTTVTKTPKAYNSLKLDLTVNGEQEKVDEFLELVERISPFTSIVELNIKKTFNKERDMTVTVAELLLNTYYYTQKIDSNITDQLPSVGEKELKAFNTIQQFMPSGFRPSTEIESADLEDLFGVRGLF
jgi:hypothetical protein